MITTHDPVRQLKHLRNCLSQNNRPIGFLLSAGCPYSIKNKKDEHLIPDIKGLTDSVKKALNKNINYTRLLEEAKKADKKENNIEEILSFVRSLKDVAKGGTVRGFTEKELMDIEVEMCKSISSTMDVELPNDKTPYHQLVNWITSIDRETPVEIFTTNYDLLMEQALEHSMHPYFDGFVGSRKPFFDPTLEKSIDKDSIPKHWTRLWKIHGSINWYPEGESITRLTSVNKDGDNLIYPSHLKYSESRKMPYLALIDQLGNFIRQNNSILILAGYSFRDGHINDTIINALHANPTAIVYGLLYDKLSDYPDALKNNRPNLSIWAFDNAIIGTTRAAWGKPDDVKLKEEDLSGAVDISGAEPQVKLGDFNTLGNYLQSIIGQNNETEKNGL